MTRTQADLLVLMAALIWGVAFYFQKTAMTHVGPLLFLGLRSALAAAALLPFAIIEARKTSQAPASVMPYALLGGGFFFIAGAMQQTGMLTATVTNTSFLTALYVVITPFLLWLWRRDRPDLRIWFAAGLAFVGIWALGGGTLASFSHGDWLVAISAIGWSAYMVITGESGKVGKPMQYTCLQFTVIACLALLPAAAFETISWQAITDGAVPILYVGILSSALTFALLANAVRYIPASRASIMLSSETLFAAAAGYAFLGERLSTLGWCGAALVFSAILFIQTGHR
jgi:drug/metabolite transporter (DMT)-like permease